MARSWDGIAWKAMTVPTVGRFSTLYAVSCLSTSFCIAAGAGELAPLAQRWDGARWTAMTVANPPRNGYFESVSCAATDDCMAVGPGSGLDSRPTVFHFDGTRWTRTPLPAVDGTLSAVDCPAVGNCLAVGGFESPLALAWNGSTWTTSDIPTVSDDVSCPAPGECVATAGEGVSVLSGGTWASSQTSGQSANFRLSCIAIDACITAGQKDGIQLSPSYFASWDGTAFTALEADDPFVTFDVGMNGATCTGPDFCVAVGSYNRGVEVALVEMWNGSSWTSSTLSDPDGVGPRHEDGPVLQDVSCATSGYCVAVGEDDDEQGVTFVWSNGKWTPQPYPRLGARREGNDLEGVSCAGVSACSAVGTVWYPRARPAAILAGAVGRWDGRKWVSTVGPAQTTFEDISCTSKTSCVIVGARYERNDPFPLVMTWNGRRLRSVKLAVGGRGGSLAGVSCATQSSCTAVGISGRQALVVSLKRGRWQKVKTPTSVTAAGLYASKVSCPTSTRCLMTQSTGSGRVLELRGKSWRTTSLTGVAPARSSLNDISCGTSGCIIAGNERSYARPMILRNP